MARLQLTLVAFLLFSTLTSGQHVRVNGQSSDGGGGAPVDASFVVSTPNATLTNEVLVSAVAVPSFESKDSFWFRPSGSALSAVGTIAPTNLDTGVAAVDLTKADGPYVSYTTGASIGNQAGISSGINTLVQMRHDPTCYWVVTTGPVITNIRMWVLLGLTLGNIGNNDDPNTDAIGFRFSTVAGDTGWRPVNKAQGTAITVGTAIGTVDVSTRYLLKFQVTGNGTSADFSVNGSAPTTVTANLPPAANQMGMFVGLINTTAASHVWSISRAYCEQGS